MPITILGLGPGPWSQVSPKAKSILKGATNVCLRTRRHPAAKRLLRQAAVHSFDHLFERRSSSEEVAQVVVDSLLKLARRPQGVIYAVPGHPLIGDATVPLVLSQCQSQGVSATIIPSPSFVEMVVSALDQEPIAGLWVVDALAPDIDPSFPAIITQIQGRSLASRLKERLMAMYPPDHQVMLLSTAEPKGPKVTRVRLGELDHQALTGLCCLFLPPSENLASFSNLEQIIARLRAPDGCPWDRQQSHDSLRPYLIEEAYEVLQALEQGDPIKLCEELGDLLLQIMLHAQIAAEGGEFQIRDVVLTLAQKIIRRHPHVFGDLKAKDYQEVSFSWELLKQDERRPEASLLESMPRAMPALAYSQAIQRRAAQVGFDWAEFGGILDKLTEELAELSQAQTTGQRVSEFGDILFALANAARWLGVDSEQALRLANQRFYYRFGYMEQACRRRGLSLHQLTFEELNALWNEAKQQVGPF